MGHKNKRVHIVEITQLDSRRRLVLIRRDDCEHLVLLSNDRELVIEAGIRRDIQQDASFSTTLATTLKETSGDSPKGEQA